MSSALFTLTTRAEGVASLSIATDDAPYLNRSWADGFTQSMSKVDGDKTIRTLVLEGGASYFSAGASRAALAGTSAANLPSSHAALAARALLDLSIPVVAAASGHAIGGGLLLALWCDALVLGEESLYGANFMALGFTPGMGATYAVPGAFGDSLGRELLFTGRLLTGREIRQAGCPVSHAVRPKAEVLDRAVAIAREMAEAPRSTIVQLKGMLSAPRGEALASALRDEQDAHARQFQDPELPARIADRYSTTPLEPTPNEAP